MFAATKAEVHKLLTEAERGLEEISTGMQDYGKDGDSMDDPQMWELMRKKELLEARRRKLASLISPDTEIISAHFGLDKAGIGHQVKVEVTEKGGHLSELTLSIGTRIDSTYLSQEGLAVVSDESPLGTALLGARTGQTLNCKIGDIRKVKVLEISPSPLLE
jgi:transcription elongation GreA/GreB family factor